MDPMPSPTIRVAVFGASGYSGAEVLRLLAVHPAVELVAVGASERAGQRVDDVYPHLSPLGPIAFEELDASVSGRADLAFLALPHGRSALVAPDLLEGGLRVIDLAGDFRLPAEEYPAWYGFEHPAPEWLGKAVYGLPELFRPQIADAVLVANPGCYPTAVTLALAPLLAAGAVSPHGIVIDAKSGVSGAGAKPTETVHYAHTEGSVRPYRVGTHQHTPEIEMALARSIGRVPQVTFVPHLVPAVRGVLVTCYATMTAPATTEDLAAGLAAAYESAPFVRVLPTGRMPDPKRVTGSNVCEIGVAVDPRTGTAVVVGAVDNLVKGAAGQAVQNMNLMLGLEETTALPTIGLYP